MLPISATSIFETILRNAGNQQVASEGETVDLEELIGGKSPEEAQVLLHALVASEIAKILRVGEETITPESILKDIGLDSLMAMELGMGFQQKTGFDIPLSGVGESTTVSDVVSRLRERVAKHKGDEAVVVQDQVAERLLQNHVVTQQKAAIH
jgi:phthiocerol/phenolphthiocerol synthesis type-I polyketide synthase C